MFSVKEDHAEAVDPAEGIEQFLLEGGQDGLRALRHHDASQCNCCNDDKTRYNDVIFIINNK